MSERVLKETGRKTEWASRTASPGAEGNSMRPVPGKRRPVKLDRQCGQLLLMALDARSSLGEEDTV